MSLTVIQQPPAMVFSRNPVVLKFAALDDGGLPFGLRGARASMTWTAETAITTDNTVTLEWTEPSGITGSITFTAKVAPATSTQIPSAGSTFATFDEYLNWVAEVIGAHPQVSPLFQVLIDEALNAIYVQARDTDALWDVQFTGSPGAQIDLDADVATDNSPPDGYKIILDVFVERVYGSAQYAHAASLHADPNTDSEVWFDLSTILHKEGLLGMPDPPLPVFDTAAPYLAPVVRNYYVRYTELVETPVSTILADTQFFIGGISQPLFADQNLFGALDATNSLLTWRPDGHEVAPAEPHYLAWLNYTNEVQEVKLAVTLTTPTSAETNFAYQNNGIEVPAKHVIVFPVSLAVLLDAMSIENDTVQRYTVRVVTNDSNPETTIEYLSQGRSYYVDRRYFEDVRYIQYLSGFYLPETLRCTGLFQTDLDVQRQESTRILTPDYSATTQERFQFAQEWTNYFRYRTGFMRRFDLDALQELMIYGQAYEVYETGYIPLMLRGSAWRIHETGQNLYTAEIEAMPALRAVNYSNINIQLSEDQDGWLLVAGDYWRTVFGQIWNLV